MTIVTKFQINDLLRHKYGNGFEREFAGKRTVRYEVLYISTETCSAGTQIFYTCRPITVVSTKRGHGIEDDIVSVDVQVADLADLSRCKFREDEVIECDPETLAHIHSGTTAINQNEAK